MNGKHPHKALSTVRINSIKSKGRFADGNGLYLVVDPSGAKRWVLRTMVRGKRRDIGLGGLKLVSLAEAREKAAEFRKMAREGGDPVAERRKATKTAPTFKEAAKAVYESYKAAWKNPKHVAQWISSMEAYAFPIIGTLRVDEIETTDVMRVLSPIWLSKPETARRVRQRMKSTLDWAKASGFRSGDNPVDGVTSGLPKHTDRDNHFQAIPYKEVPKFVVALRDSNTNEIVRLAFELLILTATRTNEVLNADWAEIDLKKKVWTIPGSRMKTSQEHRIPLSSRALELFKRAQKIGNEEGIVFPGRDSKKPLSNMAFLMSIRRMGLDFTAHGFRSAFRDWAAETTNYPRDVCEMALAHSIKNKTEAAYRRGDLFEKRKELMKSWDRFIVGKPTKMQS
ncbi:MAG: tyrosine-type recombinase/integrase [Afipia sp.]|jgi:integrase|nr:tyrosine-type recombinase/integrase [Afipia sp.]